MVNIATLGHPSNGFSHVLPKGPEEQAFYDRLASQDFDIVAQLLDERPPPSIPWPQQLVRERLLFLEQYVLEHPGPDLSPAARLPDEPPDPLSDDHSYILQVESGLSLEVIAARGYRTITDHKELTAMGFTSKHARVPGLLLPLHTTDGAQPFCQYRPDDPHDPKRKYETPGKQGMRLDCPPTCRAQLKDPNIPLWVTEGIKKADALASHGACAIALLGVSSFKGKNLFGGVTFLADWDYIAPNGRDVRIVFDNDLMRKPQVREALERLTEHLQRKGAHVSAVYLPLDGPKGVDEVLARGTTLDDLKKLLEGPRPQPQAAKPIAKLLDKAPLSLRRPLALIDGQTYAACWPYVELTNTEALDKAGNVIRLQAPQVTTAQHLHVVRGDGRVFGPSGDPLEELGLLMKLESQPREDRLWQTPSVKAYEGGARPDPADVFRRVASVYDHYLDFNRSLAPQAKMAKLSACLSLMTWFSEACDVMPYPWANGEWGSGKTKWGTVWALTSYLGEMLPLSGSFAALRDLADQGAALLFDDAENIDHPKTDPDKRTLLLAGNRRGVSVPLKEPTGDQGWKIRWVNAYCPRGFTASSQPHGALETRALLLPLIKSADEAKSNRDAVAVERWPCSWRQLQDDLWATALMLLPTAKTTWAEFDQETEVIGRDFEPWRAPLMIARLFERKGVQGLEPEIRSVMTASLKEKGDAPRNYATKVVEALGALAFGPLETWSMSDSRTASDGPDGFRGEVEFTAKQISEQVIELAHAEDDTSWATAQGVGYVLNKLRVPQKRDSSTKKRDRLRTLSKKDIADMLRAYGLLSLKPSEVSEAVRLSDFHDDVNDAETSETSETSETDEDGEEAEWQR